MLSEKVALIANARYVVGLSATIKLRASNSPWRSSGSPSGFVSGFGTLMNDELDLRALIDDDGAQIQNGRESDPTSMLRNHGSQIDAIIHPIEKRQHELPAAARFQAQWNHVTLQAHVQPPSNEPHLGMIHQLLAFQLRLIHTIGALIISRNRSAVDEPLLKDEAQRNNDMTCSLRALLGESGEKFPRLGSETGPMSRFECQSTATTLHITTASGPGKPLPYAFSMSSHIVVGLTLSLLTLSLTFSGTWKAPANLAPVLFGLTMILAILGGINESEKARHEDDRSSASPIP